MAFNIKEFVKEINQSQMTLQGKLIIIDRKGDREEHDLESEVTPKDGMMVTGIEWIEDGSKQFKDIYFIKSVNGISSSNFK